MGEGLPIVISLGTVLTLLVTFRSGVGFLPKLFAWLLLAWLSYFYWAEIYVFYAGFSQVGLKTGFVKAAERLFAALPVVFFALILVAFLITSARDSARVLWLLFSLSFIATVAKFMLLLL